MGKFREKLQRFMIGRYGMDQLNQFLLYAVLAVILINLFVRVWPSCFFISGCFPGISASAIRRTRRSCG